VEKKLKALFEKYNDKSWKVKSGAYDTY
jgi:hypothetical protein